MFWKTVFMHSEFCLYVLPSSVVLVLQLEKLLLISTWKQEYLLYKLRFSCRLFSKHYKEHNKGFVFKYCSFLYGKKKKKFTYRVEISACQKCVFYRTEIHGTVLKQSFRIEYLVKQKQEARLLGTEVWHRRGK